MDHPEVMLVFPPVVYSNFGRYYPSTAVLAAFLETRGISTLQVDLNQSLLSHVIDHQFVQGVLAREEETLSSVQGSEGDVSLEPSLKQLLAAKVVSQRPDCFRDSCGKLLPAGHPKAPLELLSALSNSFYLDPPLSALTSSQLHELPESRAFERFLLEHDALQSVPPSVRMVGISVPMGPQLGPSLLLAKMLRQLYELRIVLGGPTLTLLSRPSIAALLRANEYVDAVVQYQGEVPLFELSQHFSQGGNEPWRIPGVLALAKGELVGTSGLPTLPKLNELPFGLYDKLLLDRLAVPEIAVRQAEGCYWGQCAYCDYIELYPKARGRYRPQYVTRLVEEMKWHIKRYGINRFCLITEALPPRVGRDLAAGIIDAGLAVQWHSFAMVDPKFDLETLTLMSQSGCASLCIGVETVIDRVLKLVRKRATREMTLRFFAHCRNAGVKLEINLIPNLPGTTREEALEALEIIEQNLDGIAAVSVFPFEATRSSDIGRDPDYFGLKVIEPSKNEGGQAEFCANHLPVEDPAMPEADLHYVVDRYSRLACRVTRRELGELQPVGAESSSTEDAALFRFDDRYIAFLLPDDRYRDLGPLVFNWLTGRMRHFSGLWDPIFRFIKREQGITFNHLAQFLGGLTDLDGIANEAVTNYTLGRLRNEGILIPEQPQRQTTTVGASGSGLDN